MAIRLIRRLLWITWCGGWKELLSLLRGCRCVTPLRLSRTSGLSSEELLVLSLLLAFSLYGHGLEPKQSVVDPPGDIYGEDGAGVNGARDRVLPSVKHLIKLLAQGAVRGAVGVHEDIVQLVTQEEGVWRADVLGDGVQDV